MKNFKTFIVLFLICAITINGFPMDVNASTKKKHVHSYRTVFEKESTCTERGYRIDFCKKCFNVKRERLPLEEHAYQENILVDGTCFDAGVKEISCVKCDDSYIEEIPRQHNYLLVDDCAEEEAILVYECEYCGNRRGFDSEDAESIEQRNLMISPDMMEKLSTVYDIPEEDLRMLDENSVSNMIADVDDVVLVDTQESYVVIEENIDGTDIVYEFNENEYNEYVDFMNGQNAPQDDENDSNEGLSASKAKVSRNKDYGAMLITTSVWSIDKTTGAMSASFSWVNPPSFRLKDYVALSLRKGTFKADSQSGYYLCNYNKNGTTATYQKNFPSPSDTKWKEKGAGVGIAFNMYKPDYTVKSDRAYIYAKFTKSGKSEGVESTYLHQRASINVSPSLSITRNGADLSGGVTIGIDYKKYEGYVDTQW